jgi:hypothetical protein
VTALHNQSVATLMTRTCGLQGGFARNERGDLMTKRQGRIHRKGRIYRFTVNSTEYSAFIWHTGVHFCGRIEDQPHAPQPTARTALGVRDTLQQWIVAQSVTEEP